MLVCLGPIGVEGEEVLMIPEASALGVLVCLMVAKLLSRGESSASASAVASSRSSSE